MNKSSSALYWCPTFKFTKHFYIPLVLSTTSRARIIISLYRWGSENKGTCWDSHTAKQRLKTIWNDSQSRSLSSLSGIELVLKNVSHESEWKVWCEWALPYEGKRIEEENPGRRVLFKVGQEVPDRDRSRWWMYQLSISIMVNLINYQLVWWWTYRLSISIIANISIIN